MSDIKKALRNNITLSRENAKFKIKKQILNDQIIRLEIVLGTKLKEEIENHHATKVELIQEKKYVFRMSKWTKDLDNILASHRIDNDGDLAQDMNVMSVQKGKTEILSEEVKKAIFRVKHVVAPIATFYNNYYIC